MESRITELEIKISYTEDLVDELNRIVFRQQQQIDLLINEIKTLRDQVQAAAPAEQRSLRDELPPHY
jgi:SlyX protein